MRSDTKTEPKPERPPGFGIDAFLWLQLAAPFEATEVKFRAGAPSGNRALALAYVDARVIQDRLDNVIGPADWQNEYIPLPNGCVECRISLRIGCEWITKSDVGSPSEQPDEGDRTKAAYSDALKRAAVQWGIGRYLYRLPAQWCDYDPQKRQLAKRPTLPAWALPAKAQAPAAGGQNAPADARPVAAPSELISGVQLDELLVLLKDAGLSVERLCKTYAIDSPSDLPAAKLADAHDRIVKFKAGQSGTTTTKTKKQGAK